MYSIISIGLLFLSIALNASAVPVPLDTQFVTDVDKNNASQVENAKMVEDAKAIANGQITNMRTALANPTSAKSQNLIKAAFGNVDAAQIEKIKGTVNQLHTGTMLINDAKVSNDVDLGGTPVGVKVGSKYAAPVKLGRTFYSKGNSDALRAGTLIHEATHFHAYTGDHVEADGSTIKPGWKEQNTNLAKAYSGNADPPKSEADLSKEYKDIRDKSKNMEENADSYRVFASLCSQPGALRRRDLRVLHRAFMDADEDATEYFMKRADSCALPPGYFAKMAAAKRAKEAAAGKTGKTSAPASPKPVDHKDAAPARGAHASAGHTASSAQKPAADRKAGKEVKAAVSKAPKGSKKPAGTKGKKTSGGQIGAAGHKAVVPHGAAKGVKAEHPAIKHAAHAGPKANSVRGSSKTALKKPTAGATTGHAGAAGRKSAADKKKTVAVHKLGKAPKPEHAAAGHPAPAGHKPAAGTKPAVPPRTGKGGKNVHAASGHAKSALKAPPSGKANPSKQPLAHHGSASSATAAGKVAKPGRKSTSSAKKITAAPRKPAGSAHVVAAPAVKKGKSVGKLAVHKHS